MSDFDVVEVEVGRGPAVVEIPVVLAQGEKGEDGRTLLHGVGAPGADLGADDDFYIDTDAWDIYGPKAAGTWPAGLSLLSGEGGGAAGDSAYEVALENGFVGTVEEWLASLTGADGASAYQVWLDAGNTGTVEDFLAAIKGDPGEQGVQGEQGFQGVQGEQGDTGDTGAVGASAYQVWLDAGNIGSVEDFLAAIKGDPGEQGVQGAAGTDGEDGASAYDLAVAAGFVGTEAEWLASLMGAAGADGEDGADGADGTIITVSATEPSNPVEGDLWLDIS